MYATHNPAYALSDVANEILVSDNMKCINDAVCVECFDLLKTIQTIQEKIQTTSDHDIIYDISIAIESIITYLKHQLRDAQQRKAKIAVPENLGHGSVFWLRDFAQKILSCQLREGPETIFYEERNKFACNYAS